ncbi:MAG: NADH-quinone oxidoreductase subunit C [Deltaproteobacteria bacterium]|nr:NADH-quinone oxidoreductase subunit C [Deltaproteobacteria bacterium]
MSFEKLKSELATLAEQLIDSLLIADTDHALTGTDLELTVLPENVPAAGLILDQANYTLEAISGIDWLTQGRIEIVYDYTCFESGERVTVRTFVGREQPQLPTLSGVYPGADWHERETHDFFGVIFSGHPDLTPLLLPEDADFHPLRKDFTG